MRHRTLAATAALLLGGVLATGAAHAGPRVHWEVTVETPTIRLPGNVVLPLPPILVPRAVKGSPTYDEWGHGEPRRWDRDGDGIPNRYDRTDNRHWDRDGDGIPNRHDAYPYDPRNGRGWHGHRGRHRDHSHWNEGRGGRDEGPHGPGRR